MPDNRPIGVFDSGLGGLTVLKAVMEQLPSENTVYFGDSGRTPYGSKSPETVAKYAGQIVRFLQSQDVKMIVIACNTVSACASDLVREMAGVPVVEVISPGSATAVAQSQNRRIGVIGTKNTVASEVYIRAIQSLAAPDTRICQQACPMFVSLAEEGWWNTPITRAIAGEYLKDLLACDIDTLLLGCTHYPLLSEAIGAVAGPGVQLINAGHSVAREVYQTLDRNGQLNAKAQLPSHTFYTSDSITQFSQMGSAFLDHQIDNVSRIDIEQY